MYRLLRCALLTLANHVVDDIPGSLTKNPFGEFALVESDFRDAESCYLYDDKKNGVWVTSGTVAASESSPKGTGQRNKEQTSMKPRVVEEARGCTPCFRPRTVTERRGPGKWTSGLIRVTPTLKR